MTRGAGSAGFNASAALVAAPAALVDHDLGAERFIRDSIWGRVMTFRAGLGLDGNTRLSMTDLAVDPKIVEVVVVRHPQGGRVSLVMTFLASDP